MKRPHPQSALLVVRHRLALTVLVAMLSMLDTLAAPPPLAHALSLTYLTLSPASVYPGRNTTVTGTGFSCLGPTKLKIAFVQVDAPDQIMMSVPVTPRCDTTTFTATVTVPRVAAAGSYKIYANISSQDFTGINASLQVLPWSSWPSFGYNEQHDRSNPQGMTQSASTIGSLTRAWSFATGNTVVSSPAVAGGIVYVGSHDHNVYALRAGSGTQVWSFTTGGIVSSSPAVVNDTIYVGLHDHTVSAFWPSF